MLNLNCLYLLFLQSINLFSMPNEQDSQSQNASFEEEQQQQQYQNQDQGQQGLQNNEQSEYSESIYTHVNINHRTQLQNCFNFQIPRFQINFSIRPGQSFVNQSFRQSEYQQSESSRNYEYQYSEDFSQSANEFSDQEHYFIHENISSANSNHHLYQESQSVMQIQEKGLSEARISTFPEMIWTSTHSRFNKGQQCSFCLQEYQIYDTLKVINCMHRFHKDCLVKWLKNKNNCPLCKLVLQSN